MKMVSRRYDIIFAFHWQLSFNFQTPKDNWGKLLCRRNWREGEIYNYLVEKLIIKLESKINGKLFLI